MPSKKSHKSHRRSAFSIDDLTAGNLPAMNLNIGTALNQIDLPVRSTAPNHSFPGITVIVNGVPTVDVGSHKVTANTGTQAGSNKVATNTADIGTQVGGHKVAANTASTRTVATQVRPRPRATATVGTQAGSRPATANASTQAFLGSDPLSTVIARENGNAFWAPIVYNDSISAFEKHTSAKRTPTRSKASNKPTQRYKVNQVNRNVNGKPK